MKTVTNILRFTFLLLLLIVSIHSSLFGRHDCYADVGVDNNAAYETPSMIDCPENCTLRCGNDKDNDGVPDQFDLDDDNDGILDSDECTMITSTEILVGADFTDADGGSGTVSNLTFATSPAGTNGTFTYTNVVNANVFSGGVRATFGPGVNVGQIDLFADNIGETTNTCVIQENEIQIIDFDAADITFQLQLFSECGQLLLPCQYDINITGGTSTLSPVNNLGGGVFEYTLTGTFGNNTALSITSTGGALLNQIIFNVTSNSSNDFILFRNIRTKLTCDDTDGDGLSNQIDLDSDNDGIPDAIEACGNIGLTLDQCSLDFDGDGGYTNIDADDCPTGEVDLAQCYGAPNDTDGDGTPDFLDLDSDDDGCADNTEALTDGFGTSTGTYLPGDGTTTTTDDCGLLLNTISGTCPIPIDNGWIDIPTTEAISCPTDIALMGVDENDITAANSGYDYSASPVYITDYPAANITTEFDVLCTSGDPEFGVCTYSVTYQDVIIGRVGCDLTVERTFSLITNCNVNTCVQTFTVSQSPPEPMLVCPPDLNLCAADGSNVFDAMFADGNPITQAMGTEANPIIGGTNANVVSTAGIIDASTLSVGTYTFTLNYESPAGCLGTPVTCTFTVFNPSCANAGGFPRN